MYLERRLLPPFCTCSLIGSIVDNGSLVLGNPISGFPLLFVCQWSMGFMRISSVQVQPCFLTLSTSCCRRDELADGRWLQRCIHCLWVSAAPRVKLGWTLKVLQLTKICKSQRTWAENNMEWTSQQRAAPLAGVNSQSNAELCGLFPLAEVDERTHLFLMHFFI